MYILNFLNVLDDVERNIQVSILVVVVVFLIITSMLSTFFIMHSIRKKNESAVRLKLFTSDRVFIINYGQQTVDFFDFNELRKMQTVSFLEFLNTFSDYDQNNVRTFIVNLLNSNFDIDSEDAIILTDVLIPVNKKKITYRAILRCKQVDKDNQTIYIDATRLMHTPVEHHSTKKNAKHDVYELSVIKKMYDEGRFNKGTMHVFRFVQKPNTVSFTNDYAFRRFLIDSLYAITNNNISFFCYSGDCLEFTILDIRTMNDYQMSRFIFDMVHQLDQFCEIRGLNNIYSYNVCSAQVSDLPLYFDNAYAALNVLFKTAIEINRKVSTFKTEMNESSVIESTYKLEINRILKDKDFEVSFCPIVHCTNSRAYVTGYLSSTKFKSSLIDNNNDIFKYASDFGLSNEILSLVLHKIIPPFISQCQNLGTTKLGIGISIKDVDNVLKVIDHINKANTIKIILIIQSVQMIDLEDNQAVFEKIQLLHQRGIETGIYMKVNDYILKEKTYNLFDYFLVNPELEVNVKQDSRNFIKVQGLFEKINKLGKPIIAVGSNSFQGIELLSKSGIRDFSNDVISKNSSMLLPINPKIYKKLLTMVK